MEEIMRDVAEEKCCSEKKSDIGKATVRHTDMRSITDAF